MSGSAFLVPSAAALLAQVNAGPPEDPSPSGQRAALDGAMAAIGWPSADAHASFALASGAGVHLFAPEFADAGLPLVIYLHGGSFVAGGVVSHAGIAAALARKCGAMVALIDYRLTPEHPLPAALDDAVAAIESLIGDDRGLGYDRSRIVMLGDSAGGWLAASACARLVGRIRVDRLVLVNPMITPRPGRTGSRDQYAVGFFAQSAEFDGAWALAGEWAAGQVHPGDDPAALALFPPTYLISNEADPVRDEGEDFAEALSAAGVPVLSLRLRGLVHAAWLFPKALPEADMLVDLVVGAIGVGPRS